MRRTLPVAGIAALALVLSACGGGDSESDDKKSPNEVDPASLSAELTWWDTSDPTNEAPAFKELIKKFNAEYPKVKINYQSVPFGEAQNKFKTAAEAGQGAPDILRAEVAWVPEFAAAGHLYALDGTPLLEDGDFLETPLSSNVYDGKTYGVPQVTDTLGLMYNKELFAKAGIEKAPTTWEEVKEDAALLKDKAGVDGIYVNSAGYFLLPFMYGEGGDLVDTESKTIEVASDENKAGIKVAQDLVTSGAAPKPDANDSYGTMMTLFKEGKVGMIINGPWEVANISNDPKFGGFDNLGIAPVPGGSAGAGAPVGGHNYVVYSGMDEAKADAATAFIQFMTSAESEAYLADELGLLPTNEGAYDLVKDNERVSAWKAALDVSVARPWIPEGGLFFAPLDEMATRVLVKDEDVSKVLDQTADKFKSDVVPDYDLP
ncbi:arabinogalactan oligomer/maltooligosaccharide transport system substrate-binding protein [Nocardioides aromaticivorans]|uniref:Arabinogalactan oligomer/maltooligosaccharide transport system substrate-binding protein n=1 Tax=Nocardioides aromaticivorans TaxID=200618 RepID=A0A7Y9ZIX5_9ACTN|nr:extracellular solute-binding protein [Nocardioides aromaticivorans]NYI44785.1 arabinogalactan oligomer/maltooligosaccharide transport system substrate-binding protein [Nocardioides aromaticivorans]